MIKALSTFINNIMSKFKETLSNALKKSEDILEEMPQASKVEDFDLGSLYNRIESDLEEVGKFEIYTVKRSTGGEFVHEFLVDDKNKPVLYSSYKVSEGFGIFEKSIYQDSNVKGLARRFYVHHLLPTYGVIISDDSLTPAGLKFYENMFAYTTIKVIDTSTQQLGSLNSVEELADYYGVKNGKRFRFMVTPKQ